MGKRPPDRYRVTTGTNNPRDYTHPIQPQDQPPPAIPALHKQQFTEAAASAPLVGTHASPLLDMDEQVVWQQEHHAPSDNQQEGGLDATHHDALVGQLAKAAAKPRAKDLRSLLSVAALSQRDVLLEDILGQMQATVPAGPQQGGTQQRPSKRKRRPAGPLGYDPSYSGRPVCRPPVGGGAGTPQPRVPAKQKERGAEQKERGAAISPQPMVEEGPTRGPGSGSGRSRFSKQQQRMHMEQCLSSTSRPSQHRPQRRRRTLLELLDNVEAAMSKRNLDKDFAVEPSCDGGSSGGSVDTIPTAVNKKSNADMKKSAKRDSKENQPPCVDGGHEAVGKQGVRDTGGPKSCPEQWMSSQQGVFDFECADSVLEELEARLASQLEAAAVAAGHVKPAVHGGGGGGGGTSLQQASIQQAPLQHPQKQLPPIQPPSIQHAPQHGTLPIPHTQAAAAEARIRTAHAVIRGEAVDHTRPLPVVRLRQRVLEVQQGVVQSSLRVVDESTGVQVMVHLHDCWAEIDAHPGDVVNIITETVDMTGNHAAQYGSMHVLHVSMGKGLLVLHPDILISGTRVSTSFDCIRAAVLEEHIGGGSNAKAVEGTLLHELFQVALVQQLTNPDVLHDQARRLVAASTEKLYSVGLDEHQAMTRMSDAIPLMVGFVTTYCQTSTTNTIHPPTHNHQPNTSSHWAPPHAAHHPQQPHNPPGGGTHDTTPQIHIAAVLDVEESVWAPTYGLKGQVDATLLVQLAGEGSPGGPQGGTRLMPLELKSGRPHVSHNAQVLLYFLLLAERYNGVVTSGLLWYTSQQQPHVVRHKPAEISALMQQRNRLAAALAHPHTLPPMLREEHRCRRCFQLSHCTLLHKALEGGSSATAGMGGVFEERVGHLDGASAAWLAHWYRLVAVEEGGLLETKSELWTMNGTDREASGQCIAGLTLETTTLPIPTSPPPYAYTFMRRHPQVHPSAADEGPREDVQNVFKATTVEHGVVPGELVVLGTEGICGQAGMARGVVRIMTDTYITVETNKPIPDRWCGMGGGVGGATIGMEAHGGIKEEENKGEHMTWRIDRDAIASTFVRMRSNLLALCKGNDLRTRRLRTLLVHGAAPAAPAVVSSLVQGSAHLNEEQQRAVLRVLGTHDYTLILGMPGAGKTTTICHAIVNLIARGKSVLVCSYTNSALDNILCKLVDMEVHLLRLGRTEAAHPDVQPFMLGGTRFPDTSTPAIHMLANTTPVVGCTCLGTNHPLLERRMFDVVIVDEAGQVTVPAVLGPLLRARAFVLVGDHYQLPPLVSSKEAYERGLGASLFRMLAEAHPQAVVTLQRQFRMAQEIMDVANELVYDGDMQCGAEAVATATLCLTGDVAGACGGEPWLSQVVAPHPRVVFIDTDSAMLLETTAGDAVCNHGEAAAVVRAARALIRGGLAPSALGVISPYRAQTSLLTRLLHHAQLDEVEVLTIDKAQGRDKDVMLLSLVRSNPQQQAGRLLADWRRINVALTRAKKKMVLFGSASTLQSVPLFARLLEMARARGWLADVGSGV